MDKLRLKIEVIEANLKDKSTDYKHLEEIIDDIKDFIVELDKKSAISEEKMSHIMYLMGSFKEQLDMVQKSGNKMNDKSRDLVEKVLMALLGGLITFIFNQKG